MQNNTVSFAVLGRVLEDLGFVRKKVGGPQVVFEHAPSATVFLFALTSPAMKSPRAILSACGKSWMKRA